MFLLVIRFIGDASTAMLISLLVAIYTMGLARKIPIKKLWILVQQRLRILV